MNVQLVKKLLLCESLLNRIIENKKYMSEWFKSQFPYFQRMYYMGEEELQEIRKYLSRGMKDKNQIIEIVKKSVQAQEYAKAEADRRRSEEAQREKEREAEYKAEMEARIAKAEMESAVRSYFRGIQNNQDELVRLEKDRNETLDRIEDSLKRL